MQTTKATSRRYGYRLVGAEYLEWMVLDGDPQPFFTGKVYASEWQAQERVDALNRQLAAREGRRQRS